ncbi:P-loop containing nucleoside triphosphate hydrolase protein [Auriculariales sp. MPI-PUGE-AT-0066]|nr:P-loop containing nucleoside triphosphate hydrolase protein [Auriculariales sp. MPI-PUGE-AT-0066]
MNNGHLDVADGPPMRHSKFGTWDIYEDRGPHRGVGPGDIAASFRHGLDQARALGRNSRYVWMLVQMLREVPASAIAYIVIHFLIRVALPPLELWFSGQLAMLFGGAGSFAQRGMPQFSLSGMFGRGHGGPPGMGGSGHDWPMRGGMRRSWQRDRVGQADTDASTSTPTLNPTWLAFIILFGTFSGMFSHYMRGFKYMLQQRCIQAIQRFFMLHMVKSRVRLDMPTFLEPAVARQLERSDQHAYFWRGLDAVIRVATTFLNFFGAMGVLFWFVWKNPVAMPVLWAAIFSQVFMFVSHLRGQTVRTDPRYTQLYGYQATVSEREYKQEVLAYNLGSFLEQRSKELIQDLGDNAAIQFRGEDFDRMRDHSRMMTLNGVSMFIFRELPNFMVALLCIRSPEHIPLLLSCRGMIQRGMHEAEMSLRRFSLEVRRSTQTLTDVKAAFEVANVKNMIEDGPTAFPENAQDTATKGIEIEFRNVSFRYPKADQWALRQVSFKILRGELAVIVGFNGSGKSTVLKLVARLYDPTEGDIFIDGRNIKSIRIADLRETIAALFQNFTIFPLSIRENVGLGDTAHANDEDRIQQALSMAGADFEDKLKNGYDTYLTHPIQDHFSNLPEDTETIFGQKVNYQPHQEHMSNRRDVELSGGQGQKVAVARVLMRMTSADDRVGLLLFDEPSASMDPVAEHNLFETLRRIRQSKTMIFSTHRYGNLVQHAGQVIFMQDGRVLECGTHAQLVKQDGGYAAMWKLQARAFASPP